MMTPPNFRDGALPVARGGWKRSRALPVGINWAGWPAHLQSGESSVQTILLQVLLHETDDASGERKTETVTAAADSKTAAGETYSADSISNAILDFSFY